MIKHKWCVVCDGFRLHDVDKFTRMGEDGSPERVYVSECESCKTKVEITEYIEVKNASV